MLVIKEDSLQRFLANIKDFSNYSVLFVKAELDCDALQKIFQLTQLRSICLPRIACVDFPSDMAQMRNLESIILGLPASEKSIPEEVFQLDLLKTLEIRSYSLRKVPVGLARLPRLETLSLTETEVNYIPDEVVTMPSLRRIYLPIENPGDTLKAHLQLMNPKLEVYAN